MSVSSPDSAKPAAPEHDALPAGTRFGELEILRVLGVGGFGIVYLAQDHSLEREVALKEYMPASLASRGLGPQVTIRSGSYAETYAVGLRSFVNEAKLLAKFDHPSLVKVYRFWEDNGTAYMIMPYLQGRTLRDARRAMTQAPDEAWIRAALDPIMSAIELLHREGVYHRDIAPDNILLPPEGPPILLDFGAARRVISDRTQSLTAILKPSYAPIEQYAEMTSLRQGPWTDLYALGAVMHFLLAGNPPAPATARAVQDDALPLAQRSFAGVSPRFLAAIDWALAVRPQQRPQNIDQLRAAIDGRTPLGTSAPSDATLPGSTSLMPVGPLGSAFEPTLKIDANPQAAGTTFAPTMRQTAADEASEETIIKPLTPRTAPPPRAPAATPAVTPPVAASKASSGIGRIVAVVTVVAVVAGVGAWQFMGSKETAMPPVAAANPPATSVAVVPATPTQSTSTQPTSALPAAPSTNQAAPKPVVPAAPVVGTAGSAKLAEVPPASRLMPANDAVRLKVDGQPATLAPGRPAEAPTQVAKPVERGRESAPAPAFNPGDSTNRPPSPAARAVDPAPPAEPRVRPAVQPAHEPAAPPPAAPAAVAAEPATAREACGRRVLIALALCMERECQNARYRDQPECVKIFEARRRRDLQ
jgi:serine/threonine protein kinase